MSQLDPATTTVQDLCIAALKECGQIGIGQTALPDDITDTWARLQWMLQQWQRKRWLVYHLVDYAIPCTGQETYTFGPGGQINTNSLPLYGLTSVDKITQGAGYAVGEIIELVGTGGGGATEKARIRVDVVNVFGGNGITVFTLLSPGKYNTPLPTVFTTGQGSAGVGATFNLPIWEFLQGERSVNANTVSQRPDKLESAFLRQIQNSEPNQVDYPLQILESREDYNRIRLKSLVSFPGAVFMDAAWPLSTIFAYPVPQGGGIYELHLTIKEQMPCRFAALGTVINLPYEYFSAIVFSLALRLRARYQIPAPANDPLPGMVKDSLQVLRGSNTQIAELTIDPNLTRSGLYNIFSDTIY